MGTFRGNLVLLGYPEFNQSQFRRSMHLLVQYSADGAVISLQYLNAVNKKRREFN